MKVTSEAAAVHEDWTWVAALVGSRARIVGSRRLSGGIWTGERLSGVVDWCSASNGPADVDVAHCRLNLTILFSASWAERFRLAYEAEAGRSLDPWWDIAGLMNYSQEWKTFIPLQVGNRTQVDIGGMDARMDDILELALRRTA